MKKIVMLFCSLLPLLTYAQHNQVITTEYEKMINDYHSGKLHGQQLLTLSIIAANEKRDSLGRQVANSYKLEVLTKGDVSKFINPDLKKYLTAYYSIFQTKDHLTRYLLKNPDQADLDFQQKGFSKSVVGFILRNELITPTISPNGIYTDKAPDWAVLEKKVKSQVDGATAQHLLIEAKLSWYRAKKDWENQAKYEIEKIEALGMDTAGLGRSFTNNMIFDVIFMHSNDPAILNKGIEYIKILLKHEPKKDSWIDTYANLLYKTGRKQEAIQQEKNALAIAKERSDHGRVKDYQEMLKKMLSDQPTWK